MLKTRKFWTKTRKAKFCLWFIPLLLLGQAKFYLHLISGAHHHHEVEHTIGQENDACHRAIYHADITKDCNHHGHYTKVQEHCDFQSLFFQSAAILPDQPTFEITPCLYKKYIIPVKDSNTRSLDSIHLRGPPHIA